MVFGLQIRLRDDKTGFQAIGRSAKLIFTQFVFKDSSIAALLTIIQFARVAAGALWPNFEGFKGSFIKWADAGHGCSL